MKKIIPFLFLFSCSLNQLGSGFGTKKDEVPDNELCICMEIYQPVCGKDGVTYGNACEADCIKMKHSPGACPN